MKKTKKKVKEYLVKWMQLQPEETIGLKKMKINKIPTENRFIVDYKNANS